MKTRLVTLSLILALSSITPKAQTRPEPQPQIFTCVVTIVALGIFAACAVACYWHGVTGDYSGPTNSPPLIPPHDDDPPYVPTNSVPTNFPAITVNAVQSTEHLDATPYGWLDCSSNLVTDLYRTVLQTSSSPSGPWSNAYVVTLWQSAHGSTALVEDGAGNALVTNYSRRAANGSVTNFAPLELAHSEPQRFYRAKP